VIMKRQYDDVESENRELNMKLHRTSAQQKNGMTAWWCVAMNTIGVREWLRWIVISTKRQLIS
jgi:uncharacterized protein YqcC (DUF446 family)